MIKAIFLVLVLVALASIALAATGKQSLILTTLRIPSGKKRCFFQFFEFIFQ